MAKKAVYQWDKSLSAMENIDGMINSNSSIHISLLPFKRITGVVYWANECCFIGISKQEQSVRNKAHLLGHFYLHPNSLQICSKGTRNKEDREADEFADMLLDGKTPEPSCAIYQDIINPTIELEYIFKNPEHIRDLIRWKAKQNEKTN